MHDTIERLKEIEQRLLWLACWTVHNANHLRPKKDDDVKVGGQSGILRLHGLNHDSVVFCNFET